MSRAGLTRLRDIGLGRVAIAVPARIANTGKSGIR
jgi:hypothetical protein